MNHTLQAILLLGFMAVYAQTPQITSVQSSSVECDYLVICPDELLTSALRLASYRNESAHDEIENAGVVSLSTIDREFPLDDTCPHAFRIWYALKYAVENWSRIPAHVVLVGDDSVTFNEFDTAAPPASEGMMPTFYYSATVHHSSTDSTKTATDFDYSDFPYLTVADTAPPLTRYNNRYQLTLRSAIDSFPYAMGRIPARSVQECNTYIDKLIRYERSGPAGAWYNRIVLAADDAMQGTYIDHAAMSLPHLSSAESLADHCFSGCFLDKTYLSSFVRSPSGNHEQGRNHFFSAINKGARFAVYFGHGHPNSLSDEGFLRTADTALFTNDSALAIFFSFSCSNGEFLRKSGQQMCKAYLFTANVGSIAYVAAPVETYANANTSFARSLFSGFDTTGSCTLGEALALGAAVTSGSSGRCYQILGDPAICFTRKRLTLSTAGSYADNGSFTFSTATSTVAMTPLNYRYQISFRDSVTCLDTLSPRYVADSIIAGDEGSVPGNRIDITIPSSAITGNTHLTLYVWNEQAEGRLDTIVPVLTPVTAAATASFNRPLITIKRGSITIRFPAALPTNTLRLSLFALNGACVYTCTAPVIHSMAVFNRWQSGLSRGNYLFTIATGARTFSGKVCVLE
jgi:hypothetical protein